VKETGGEKGARSSRKIRSAETEESGRIWRSGDLQEGRAGVEMNLFMGAENPRRDWGILAAENLDWKKGKPACSPARLGVLRGKKVTGDFGWVR